MWTPVRLGSSKSRTEGTRAEVSKVAHEDGTIDRVDETVEVHVRRPYGFVAADGSRGLRRRDVTVREALGDALTRDGQLAAHLYRTDGGLRVDVILKGASPWDAASTPDSPTATGSRLCRESSPTSGSLQALCRASSPEHRDLSSAPAGFHAVDGDPLGSTSAAGAPPSSRVSAAPLEGGRAFTQARPSARRPDPSSEVMTV